MYEGPDYSDRHIWDAIWDVDLALPIQPITRGLILEERAVFTAAQLQDLYGLSDQHLVELATIYAPIMAIENLHSRANCVQELADSLTVIGFDRLNSTGFRTLENFESGVVAKLANRWAGVSVFTSQEFDALKEVAARELGP